MILPPPASRSDASIASIPGERDRAVPGTEVEFGARASDTRRAVSRGRLMSWLVVWDALTTVVVLVLAGLFEGTIGPPLGEGAADVTDPLVVLLMVISPIGLAIAGAYNHRRRRDGSRLHFALKLVVVGMAVSWVALIASAVAGWPIDFAQMLALAFLLPAGWLLGRWACDRHPVVGAERAVLIGSGVVAERVLDLYGRHGGRRLEIVGRVEAGPAHEQIATDPPLLGDLPDLPSVLRSQSIDRVIVAFTPGRDAHLIDALRECVADGVQVDVVPRFYELVGPTPHASSVGGLAMMEVPGRGLSRAERALKRGMDIAGSLLLLLFASPVMAVIAVAIAVLDGRPVLFRQTREGQGGRSFDMIKFRTMRDDPASTGPGGSTTIASSAMIDAHKADSAVRVTRIGGILRRGSLDELPQLYNVLKGDMSLVGPRPLPLYESEHLTGWHRSRQDLKPGLTGLWQVMGRSELPWADRMQLDYTYVSHWSLLSDLRILARTLPAVLRKEGAV